MKLSIYGSPSSTSLIGGVGRIPRATMLEATRGERLYPLGVIGDAADAVGRAKDVLKDNPHGEKALDLAAQSAAIVAQTIRNVLLPFAAINFGVEKAKEYFEKRFAPELEAKLEGIPAEHLVEPKASMAGPLIQGLAYSFEDGSLRDLYLNLLRTSMDSRIPEGGHPAFVEIVRQLSPRDARVLAALRNSEAGAKWAYPVVRVRARMLDGSGSAVASAHIFDSSKYTPHETFNAPNDMSAVVENWVRLGLFSAEYGQQLIDDGSYDFADAIPGLDDLRNFVKMAGDKKLEFERGVLRLTDFGSAFLSATVDQSNM